jgi:1,4-dihydroxy-2-naphthoate octaprenyltransferase
MARATTPEPGSAPRQITLRAEKAWGWDESVIPFFEYSERTVAQSQRYFADLSAEQGRLIRPRLALGLLILRTTRLPFLSATFVPVVLGILAAAVNGAFDALAAILTLVGASAAHLAINVANDIFDSRSGADAANVNPTKYSGGSRVIQYGLVSMRQMAIISAALFGVATVVGLYLLVTRGSTALLAIGILGIAIGLAYTAPPLRLVYRGLGEIAVAVGFGPVMLLGAYVVQTRGMITTEAVVASVPVALLTALILYVNEVPDRRGDAKAGKRTLPVRLSRDLVLLGYSIAVAVAFGAVAIGVAFGWLPIPSLIALAALPLAGRVHAGLREQYDQPYGLMSVMAANIRLHLTVGALLVLGYTLTLVVGTIAPGTRLYVA